MKRLLLFLIVFLQRSIANDMRSFVLTVMNGQQFSCVNTTCMPFSSFAVLNSRRCQLACVNVNGCQAIGFHQSTARCDLFAGIVNQKKNFSLNPDVVTMILHTNESASSG